MGKQRASRGQERAEQPNYSAGDLLIKVGANCALFYFLSLSFAPADCLRRAAALESSQFLRRLSLRSGKLARRKWPPTVLLGGSSEDASSGAVASARVG